MPTRRMIDPAFWQSETMAGLTEAQRLLFLGLISNADDQGRMRAHPSLIRSAVYPYEDKDSAVIEDNVQVIAEAESILLYEVDGKRYLQVVNWWKYQGPQWAYPSKYPAPEGWEDRLRYRKDDKIHTKNWPLKHKPKRKDKDKEETPNDYGKDEGQEDSEADTLTDSLSDGEADRIRVSDSNNDSASEDNAPTARGKLKLTAGQREFLDKFGAKRFRLNAQRDAVLAMEQEHGTTKLIEAATWAAKRGMNVGQAIVSLETALPKWGQPKGQKTHGTVEIASGLGERA